MKRSGCSVNNNNTVQPNPKETILRVVLIHLPDSFPARAWFDKCNSRTQQVREDAKSLLYTPSGTVTPLLTYPDLLHCSAVSYVYVAWLGFLVFKHKFADISPITKQQLMRLDPIFRERMYAGEPYLWVETRAEETDHIPVPTPSDRTGRILGVELLGSPPVFDNRIIRLTPKVVEGLLEKRSRQ